VLTNQECLTLRGGPRTPRFPKKDSQDYHVSSRTASLTSGRPLGRPHWPLSSRVDKNSIKSLKTFKKLGKIMKILEFFLKIIFKHNVAL
jgi:hypothetical protein